MRGYPWGTTALDLGLLDQLGGLAGGLHLTGILAQGHLPDFADVDPHSVDLAVDLACLPQLGVLAAPTEDGLGVAVATGTAAVAPPRGLADLVAGVSSIDHSATGGGIDVRIVTDAAGHRRAVVDITGTRVWGAGGTDPADLSTNVLAMSGRQSAYAQGVLVALRKAGVRADEPVMMVGHSQGGMIAVNAARDAARTGEFRVTHVVTVGSPVGRTVATLPASVQVLSLENRRDAVPRLDGVTNPDLRNVTTVTGTAGDGTAGGSHALDQSYRPIAEAAERDGGRSVRDFLHSANGFLRGTSADQHRFRVERR